MSGRKTHLVRVPHQNRDVGKYFLLTEMSAADAEWWGWRAMLALKGTGGEVPPEIMQFGMIAVAWRGVQAFLSADVKPEAIKPLLDEMMTCVRTVRDEKRPDVATELMDGDIAESQTILWLRGEILRLHTGFSAADALSHLASAVMPGPK